VNWQFKAWWQAGGVFFGAPYTRVYGQRIICVQVIIFIITQR